MAVFANTKIIVTRLPMWKKVENFRIEMGALS